MKCESKYNIGEEVTITYPKIFGVVSEINFFGDSQRPLVSYKVDVWCNDELKDYTFDEYELSVKTEKKCGINA